MHPLDRPSAGLIHVLECSVPLQGDSGGTGHRGLTGHASGCRVAGEMLGKNAAVIVLFFVSWWVDGEALGSMGHLFVTDGLGSDLLERVDP